MKGLVQKALVLAIGVVIMVGVGCQEAEVPSTKKARLIASENMQLKKQLEQRDSEIEEIQERVDEVLATVVEENAQLRQEVSKLKAQIEELKN